MHVLYSWEDNEAVINIILIMTTHNIIFRVSNEYIYLFFFLLIEQDQASSEQCRGQFIFGCGDNDAECYRATWIVKSGFVQFNVTAQVLESQWVSIGFSENRLMVYNIKYNID